MTEKIPIPPTRSEIPAIEASTMFQFAISLSTSLRTRTISSPMFSTLKSEIPRWLRRTSASASFFAVVEPVGVGLERPRVRPGRCP